MAGVDANVAAAAEREGREGVAVVGRVVEAPPGQVDRARAGVLDLDPFGVQARVRAGVPAWRVVVDEADLDLGARGRRGDEQDESADQEREGSTAMEPPQVGLGPRPTIPTVSVSCADGEVDPRSTPPPPARPVSHCPR